VQNAEYQMVKALRSHRKYPLFKKEKRKKSAAQLQTI
jgi:hypothetical protein